MRAALLCAVSAASAAAADTGRLIISGVECVAVGEGDVAGTQTVVIKDGRISELHRGRVDVFQLGDLLMRGDGLWLIPGLIDSGIGPVRAADLQLAAVDGVTTVVFADGADRARFEALARNTELPLPRLEIQPRDLPRGSRVAADSAEGLEPEAAAALRLIPPAIVAGWTASTRRHERVAALAQGEPFSVASGMMEPFVPAQWALQRELQALQALRLPALPDPPSLLALATRGAADALGRDDLGRLAVGAVADLILLEADPRLDLSALRDVRAVVLRGRVIPRSEREMIVQVIGDGARFEGRAFASAPPWSEWSERLWTAQSRIELDGLPRGVERIAVRRIGDGFETLWQQELWPPLSSIQTVDARHDALGRLREATLLVHSIRERLVLRAVRRDDDRGWRLESTRDQTTVRAFIDDPPDGRATIMVGPIPAAVELFAALSRLPATISGFELDFGSGSVSLLPLELTVVETVPHGRDLGDVAADLPPPTNPGPETNAKPPRSYSIRQGSNGPVRASFVTSASGWPEQFAFPVPFGLWEIHPIRHSLSAPPTAPARP